MTSKDIVSKGEAKPKICGDNREENKDKTTNWKTDGRKAKPQTSKGNDIRRQTGSIQRNRILRQVTRGSLQLPKPQQPLPND